MKGQKNVGEEGERSITTEPKAESKRNVTVSLFPTRSRGAIGYLEIKERAEGVKGKKRVAKKKKKNKKGCEITTNPNWDCETK